MKGKIDKSGALSVNGITKYCPFQPGNTGATCGLWCALFNGPEKKMMIVPKSLACDHMEQTGWKLSLCNKELIFEEFTDERK